MPSFKSLFSLKNILILSLIIIFSIPAALGSLPTSVDAATAGVSASLGQSSFSVSADFPSGAFNTSSFTPGSTSFKNSGSTNGATNLASSLGKSIGEQFGVCLAKEAAGAIFATVDDLLQGTASVPDSPATTASDAADSGNSWQSFFTNCIEHATALGIGRTLLSQMTQSIVGWINGGFNGNPSFIQDPSQFFGNIGDQIANQFIGGIGGSLCPTFGVNIQIALALNYSGGGGGGGGSSGGGGSGGSRCSLSDAASSIFSSASDAFNNFDSGGGWGGFLSISQNVGNNPYGAFLQASGDLSANIASAQATQALQLNWNNGFLSQQNCDAKDAAGNCIHSSVVTPGKVVADALQSQLNVPAQQLGVADDLDKIFNALGNELISTVFNLPGTTGLLGATDSKTGKLSTYGSAGTRAANAFGFSTTTIASDENSDPALQAISDGITAASQQGNTSAQQSVNVAAEQGAVATQSAGLTGLNGPNDCGPTAAQQGTGDGTNGLAGTSQGGCSDLSVVGPDPTSGFAWWQDDLGASTQLQKIVVYPRTDTGLHTPASTSFKVFVSSAPLPAGFDPNTPPPTGVWASDTQTMDHLNPVIINISPAATGQYVSIFDTVKDQWLELASVQAFNVPTPITTGGGGGTGGGGTTGGGGGTTGPTNTGTAGASLTLGAPPGTIVNVSPGQDVQSIINSAPAGSSIVFTAGTYNISSKLSLVGNHTYYSNTGAVLNWTGGADVMGQVEGSNTVIEGLTFNGAGLYIPNTPSNVIITNNTFQNRTSGGYPQDMAIHFDGINNSSITHNTFQNWGGGDGAIIGYNPVNTHLDDNLFNDVFEGIHMVSGQSGGQANVLNSTVLRNVFNNIHRYAVEMQGPANGMEVAYNWADNFDGSSKTTLAYTLPLCDEGNGVYSKNINVHNNYAGGTGLVPIGSDGEQSWGFEIGGDGTQVANNLVNGPFLHAIVYACTTSAWSYHDNTFAGINDSTISSEAPSPVAPLPQNVYNNTISSTMLAVPTPESITTGSYWSGQ